MRPYIGQLLSLLWLLALPLSGITFAQGLSVPSEIFQPLQQKLVQKIRLKLPVTPTDSRQKSTQPDKQPVSFTLAAPTETELQSLRDQQDNRKALQVGIRRELPTLPALASWNWQDVDGGQAAHFVITSEKASRLRVLLQTEQKLPAGVEIRIYDPVDETVHETNDGTKNKPEHETSVVGLYTQYNFNQLTDSDHPVLWTPSVAGQQLGIEVFLPAGIAPGEVKLTLPLLSHVAYDLSTKQFKLSTTKAFSSCAISIACAPPKWQETAKAVARYIYTEADGQTYLCSGTLLADSDAATQIPYFLTAAHCVTENSVAATMDFFWLDRESSCGADNANPVQVSGGAVLLHSQDSLDSTLVRINNAPPAGTLMSGWSLEAMQDQDSLSGIHHALGNPKQFASGKFDTYSRLSAATNGGYTVHRDPLGDFLQVKWDQGITAPGSSGSGIWAIVDGQRLLKGSLVGGSSSCSTPDEPDEYARLDRFYPHISDWLGNIPTPLQGLLTGDGELQALTDGVLLKRYIEGARGTALLTGVTDETINISELESRLADAATNMDLDQDGLRTGATDGLLLARYLLGLRHSSLIEGIDLSGATNQDAAAITSTIDSFLQGQ